jgi:hypothetical protein
MQGAATGTIGTMGTVAAGAIGGAAGSIASQAVGMAIGAQDSFNWKGVALSAVGGGVSAGVASASAGTALGAKDIAGAIGRAALSNTISQGVGIVTGLQNGFSWRSVAASAAGAAAGYRSAQALQDFDMQDLFKQTASGMAAGATTAIARGGKFEVVRVATDAFGNALGNSLAYQGSSLREQKFAAMDKQVDEAMANGLGDGERLVANTLTDTRSRSMLDKLRAEEMARITSEAREEKLTWDSNDGGYIDADGRLHVVVNGVNPPVERPDDLIEAAGGLAIETPLAIASGAAAAVVSPLYGLYTDIASGKFGTPEGIRIGEEAASQLAQRMTFKPQTATAQYVLGKAADFVSYSGIQGLGFSELSALRSAASTAPFVADALHEVKFVGSGSGFKNPQRQYGAIGNLDALREEKADVSSVKVTGETQATALGKQVHATLAAQRHASGDFDLVNQPLANTDGSLIGVARRVNLANGTPISSSGTQVARPDAVNFGKRIILDDKPLGRPISKDRQEIVRFINAYQESQGTLPRTIGIQRYDPITGLPVRTELYTPNDFMPWIEK